MSSFQQEERILICVYYGQNGLRLIRRGADIAHKLSASLFILVLDPLPEKEYKLDKEVDMSIFQEVANEYGAELMIKRSRMKDIASMIAEEAKENKVTQIMIGQVAESLWTTLLGRSITNIILEKAPFADLHVMPQELSEENIGEFERGIQSYIKENKDGTYELSFKNEQDFDYEGIFFKWAQTDFNSGIFAFNKDGGIIEVRVKDGIVYRLIDIDEEEDEI
ncbi:universal stress protein UspA [Bacillus sp. CRN 9]|nr:universal stress protein UspA [Bacillus sp. CRN 9]